jgi:hypothetical protein
MALVLAPRGVGVAALERAQLGPPAPRAGSIPVAADPLPSERPLELTPPDLIALALRTSFAAQQTGLPDVAARRSASIDAPPEPLPLLAARASAAPVAEPPAALLLSLAAGGWLAVRRSRHPPKRGGRFSRNASMPSTASESSRLSAITAPASR